MVILDKIHRIQAEHATDMAVRWNCKAGKCGSCSVEINGMPKLACMSKLSEYKDGETITIQPMKTFPIIKDLVTDESWNFEQNKRIAPFKPKAKDKDGKYRMQQIDADRVQEFRKCIECYLCQNVCHVLRDQDKKDKFVGPRFMIRLAVTGGKDATVLPGITDLTIMRLITEVGTDLSKWKSEKHFTSWIGVAPNNHRSGKGYKKKRGRKKQR